MNVFVISESLPHHGMRQAVFNFWRCVKIVFLSILLFAVCSMFNEAKSSILSTEQQITADVRRVEMEIAHLFGYTKWPLAPTKIEYATNCRGKASFSCGEAIVLSCDTVKHQQGKSFRKKNLSGGIEVFPGYASYLSDIVHEIAHYFSRMFVDHLIKSCEQEKYLELSEGFAEYVTYEILLRESAKMNDPEFERYITAKTVRYLAQLDVSDQQPARSSLSDFPVAAAAFSPESKRYIDSRLAHFLAEKTNGKPLFMKDEDAVNDYYPRGLMRVYALRYIFTKESFENGTIKKYFCR